VVPFVLVFNFVAGFFYLLAAYALWSDRSWALLLGGAIAVATALIFAAFGVHVWTGGDFEPRTVGALVLRISFWGFWVAAARRLDPLQP